VNKHTLDLISVKHQTSDHQYQTSVEDNTFTRMLIFK